MSELGKSARTTKLVRATKLEAGMELADGKVIERVERVEGKRTMSRLTSTERGMGHARTSGWPIEAGVVRVHLVGGDPRLPRRLWPRQKVEVVVDG